MATVSITDLTNAKLDTDHIADIATSLALTAVDRLGTTKKTLQGAINSIAAIDVKGAWATSTAYVVKDAVLESGTWYICIEAHTSATFSTDLAAGKWSVLQGITDANLKDYAVRKLDFVSDMKAMTNPQAGEIIMLKDYTSGNGAGVMFFETKATTGTDDGGSVINHDTLAFRFEQIFGEVIHVKQFGAKLNATSSSDGTDDTTAFQKCSNYCIANGITAMSMRGGSARLNTQWVIENAAATGAARLDILANSDDFIYSHVTGSIAGYDTAGFGIRFDGWKDSKFQPSVNYASGTAGLVFRCRKDNNIYNKLESHTITGGDATVDRETATKVSVRYIGNEASAGSTGYVNYYNTIVNTRLTTAYKLIEHVVGDGHAGTAQPNANGSKNIICDRYIVAIDTGDTDENRYDVRFFNNAAGVVGLEGGFTFALSVDGTLNQFTLGTVEPGASSKPYRLNAGADNNQITYMQNTTNAGDDTSGGLNNLIWDRARLNGLHEINGRVAWANDGDGDINLFGTGTASHSGAGMAGLNIWHRNSNTSKVGRLGWSLTLPNAMECKVPNGFQLDLGGTWENPIKLGPNYLWSHSGNGKLYTKNAATPVSDTDGTIVGTQT